MDSGSGNEHLATINDVGEQRERIVAEAHSFLGTAYHDHGRKRKTPDGDRGGVDCATLIACVMENAGVLPQVYIDHYSPQWHIHQDEELYMATVLAHSVEVPPPALAGDIALFKIARCFAHGAIVIDWPIVIHALSGIGVVLEDVSKTRLANCQTKIFSVFPDGIR